jgi:hypothetical protein
MTESAKCAVKVTFFVRPANSASSARTQVWLLLVLDDTTSCASILERVQSHVEIRLGGALLDDVPSKLFMFVQNHGEFFRIPQGREPLLSVFEVKQLVDEGKAIINAALVTQAEYCALNSGSAEEERKQQQQQESGSEDGLVKNDSFSSIRPRSGSVLPTAFARDPTKVTPQLKHRPSPREKEMLHGGSIAPLALGLSQMDRSSSSFPSDSSKAPQRMETEEARHSPPPNNHVSTPTRAPDECVAEIVLVTPLQESISVSLTFNEGMTSSALANRAVSAIKTRIISENSNNRVCKFAAATLRFLSPPASGEQEGYSWALWEATTSDGEALVLSGNDPVPPLCSPPGAQRRRTFYLAPATRAVQPSLNARNATNAQGGPRRPVSTTRALRDAPSNSSSSPVSSFEREELDARQALAAAERRVAQLQQNNAELGVCPVPPSVAYSNHCCTNDQDALMAEVGRLRAKKMALMAELAEAQAAAIDCQRLEEQLPWFEAEARRCKDRQRQLRATLEASALSGLR